jgi:uncharacterized iron-regulated protein
MAIIKKRLAVVALAVLTGLGQTREPALAPKKESGEKKPVPITDKHYRVYDAKGNPRTLEDVLQRMLTVDVVFLGESHDDPVAHHLQEKLFRMAQERRTAAVGTPPRPLALSLEMFERDVQDALDEYLAGLITEQHFLKCTRPWNNYEKDYRPLVEHARTKKLPVIAANAPRRYVNRVGRLGAASLREIPEPQKRGLPPLPYAGASPAYAARFREVMKNHGKDTKETKETKDARHTKQPAAPKKAKTPPMPPASDRSHPKKPTGKPAVGESVSSAGSAADRGLEAQSLWDASMAYSIAEFLLRSPRAQIIHLNGRFHTEKRMGIPDHLLRYRPGTSFLVISFVPDKGFPKFDVSELSDAGDFVIVTDPSLPRSFTSSPPKK